MSTSKEVQELTTTQKPQQVVKGIIAMLVLQQAFGALAFPIAKYGLAHIEPYTFAFYRFVISSVILLTIVFFQKQSNKVERNDWIKIIGLGFLIIPFNQTLFLVGQELTAAGHGSLLFATVPIWILIAARLHLKEKTSIRRVIGIIIGLLGVVIVMWSGAVGFSIDYLWGDLIILVSVIAWAYYLSFGKNLVRKYGAFRVTAYALTSGTLLYLPYGIYAATNFDYTQTDVYDWLTVGYMAIGLSVVAYSIMYWVLKFLDASRIAVFHNLQPILATVVAYFWLGEPIGLSFVVGGLLALTGIVIAEYRN